MASSENKTIFEDSNILNKKDAVFDIGSVLIFIVESIPFAMWIWVDIK